MASVDLRIDDFEDGVLPTVCVATGEPADRFYRYRFTRTSPWIYLALVAFPFGIIVVLILAAVTRREAVGFLPVSDAAMARGRAWRRRGWALVIAAVLALCLFAYVFDSFGGRDVFVATGVAAIVSALAGLWLVARPPGSVGGRPDGSGRWVTVHPVSDAFVDAYRDQERRRIAKRRRAAELDDVI